jgi:hypothetical protein
VASEISILPNLPFQLYSVALETPCLREISGFRPRLVLAQHIDSLFFPNLARFFSSVLLTG